MEVRHFHSMKHFASSIFSFMVKIAPIKLCADIFAGGIHPALLTMDSFFFFHTTAQLHLPIALPVTIYIS